MIANTAKQVLALVMPGGKDQGIEATQRFEAVGISFGILHCGSARARMRAGILQELHAGSRQTARFTRVANVRAANH